MPLRLREGVRQDRVQERGVAHRGRLLDRGLRPRPAAGVHPALGGRGHRAERGQLADHPPRPTPASARPGVKLQGHLVMVAAPQTQTERIAQRLDLRRGHRQRRLGPDRDHLRGGARQAVGVQEQLDPAGVRKRAGQVHERGLDLLGLARRLDEIGELVQQPPDPRGAERLGGIVEPAEESLQPVAQPPLRLRLGLGLRARARTALHPRLD